MLTTLLRGAGAPPASKKFWLNVGGIWKEATVHIRIAGVWKVATPFIRVSGTWS